MVNLGDLSKPVLIEWVVLNTILIVISVVLVIKHYKDKKNKRAEDGASLLPRGDIIS